MRQYNPKKHVASSQDDKPKAVVDFYYYQSGHTKKARESFVSLVPRPEALALPDTAERATQKPTPIHRTHHENAQSWFP